MHLTSPDGYTADFPLFSLSTPWPISVFRAHQRLRLADLLSKLTRCQSFFPGTHWPEMIIIQSGKDPIYAFVGRWIPILVSPPKIDSHS